MRRTTTAERRAVHGQRRAAVGVRDRAGRSPLRISRQRRDPRGQGVPSRSDVACLQRSSATVTAERQVPLTPTIVWGPGDRRRRRGRAACVRRRKASCSRAARSSAPRRRRTSRSSRSTRAISAMPASTTTTSWSPRCSPGRSKVTLPAGLDSAAGRVRRTRRAISSRSRSSRSDADAPHQVLRRAEGLRRARRDRSRSGARDQFRHVHRDRRAAAAVAEVGQRLRRQLRLVDHHPDDHHQRDHVSAAAQERRVDAEDAGDSARGEGDPGSLLEAEGDRSGQAEDEPGDDGALQGARRQSGERLRADAADDAGSASRSTRCCRRRSSCAARRSSAGFTICRRTIRTTSRRC